MTDFVDYKPDAQPVLSAATIGVRVAAPSDIVGLARVMAVRGGEPEEHIDRAGRLIERLNVLLVAERDGVPAGWCGIQKYSIQPDAAPDWLIAGLTVVPEMRRQGIAARLLREVLRITEESAPGEPILSVINAKNLASIDLHLQLGFVEVARAATFAGIDFTGGEGVLLRYS